MVRGLHFGWAAFFSLQMTALGGLWCIFPVFEVCAHNLWLFLTCIYNLIKHVHVGVHQYSLHISLPVHVVSPAEHLSFVF